MFETFLTIAATITVVYLLLATIFPDRFMPKVKEKDKHIGANEWGVYMGRPTEVDPDKKTIKVPKRGPKERVIGGSGMYAMGKGISFRR